MTRSPRWRLRASRSSFGPSRSRRRGARSTARTAPGRRRRSRSLARAASVVNGSAALHEYGHHLIRLDASVHDLFATQDDYGAALEEDICDAIAAELLLPDELVDRFIDNRGPTAGAVLALFKTSHASREAACVRAAQRLLGEGYVMLGEGDVARFTVAVETPYRVARGVAQGPDSVIAQAARTGSARREARVRFRSGNEGTTLFADAVSDEGYTFAVFTDIPAWQELTARDPDSLFPEHEGSCRVCDWDFTTPKALCRRCNEPFCPRCGSCWCGADRSVKERRCDHCTLLLPLSCFEADSTLCRDCTE